MSAWTPGPWRISGGNIWAQTHCVAKMFTKFSKLLPDGQIEANGRLISLAPELAEALKAALSEMDAFQKYWTSPNMNLQRGESKAQETARALLAQLEA